MDRHRGTPRKDSRTNANGAGCNRPAASRAFAAGCWLRGFASGSLVQTARPPIKRLCCGAEWWRTDWAAPRARGLRFIRACPGFHTRHGCEPGPPPARPLPRAAPIWPRHGSRWPPLPGGRGSSARPVQLGRPPHGPGGRRGPSSPAWRHRGVMRSGPDAPGLGCMTSRVDYATDDWTWGLRA